MKIKNITGSKNKIALDPELSASPALHIFSRNFIRSPFFRKVNCEIEKKMRLGRQEALMWNLTPHHLPFSVTPGGEIAINGNGPICSNILQGQIALCKKIKTAQPILDAEIKAKYPLVMYISLEPNRGRWQILLCDDISVDVEAFARDVCECLRKKKDSIYRYAGFPEPEIDEIDPCD